MLAPMSDARDELAAAAAKDDPATSLRRGLQQPNAMIPPWYLYDEIGSKLFDVITMLPDYYPTRTEAAVFKEHLTAIADAVDLRGGAIVDLGAGNCEKAPQLFPLLRPRQYVPVDISEEFLENAVGRLRLEHPDIDMLAVGTDFSQRLELPDRVLTEPRVFFYPGSSIGNFTPAHATAFLGRVRAAMPGRGALLIGVDLRKDVATMVRAYDDPIGVTAAFNRNLLRNVNAIAGTDFDPEDWLHVARFDDGESRIEMHLEARRALTVRWPDGARRFGAGERIHTESSYKYTPARFRELLTAAGLRDVGMWTDERAWFGVFAAVPADA